MPLAAAQSEKFDVIIAGASFAGLALACGLLQAFDGDIRIAIVDRGSPAAAVRADGRAFAIWAGAKSVLEGLGVWDAIGPEAQAMTAIEISDSALSDAFRQTRLTYEARTPDGLPAAYMVPAATLATALYNSVIGAPAISWIAPADLRSLALGDKAAEVGLADGRRITAALCVAADGRNSKLRDEAGIATVGSPYNQIGIVTTISLEKPLGGLALQHFLPTGPFAILPLKGNRACITWSAGRDEARCVMALDDERFLAELEQRIGGRFGRIALDGPRQSWPLDIKLPRQLVGRRFALIGDAAHGVHPIAGQGVNLALRDVAALVEVLVEVARIGLDLGDGAQLERYERWRRFDSLMSATLYDGLNRLFGIDSLLARTGRGAALGVLDRLPRVKELIVAEAAGVTGELPRLMRGSAI